MSTSLEDLAIAMARVEERQKATHSLIAGSVLPAVKDHGDRLQSLEHSRVWVKGLATIAAVPGLGLIILELFSWS